MQSFGKKVFNKLCFSLFTKDLPGEVSSKIKPKYYRVKKK